MISMPHDLPEWLIDDTSDMAHGRVFVVHTHCPRFAGELVPDDGLTPDDLGGYLIAIPSGQNLCRIDWYDSMELLTGEETRCLEARWPITLEAAIQRHQAARGR